MIYVCFVYFGQTKWNIWIGLFQCNDKCLNDKTLVSFFTYQLHFSTEIRQIVFMNEYGMSHRSRLYEILEIQGNFMHGQWYHSAKSRKKKSIFNPVGVNDNSKMSIFQFHFDSTMLALTTSLQITHNSSWIWSLSFFLKIASNGTVEIFHLFHLNKQTKNCLKPYDIIRQNALFRCLCSSSTLKFATLTLPSRMDISPNSLHCAYFLPTKTFWNLFGEKFKRT